MLVGQQKIWVGDNLEQRRLYRKVGIWLAIKPLLFNSIERLSRGRKHLEPNPSNVAFAEVNQHVLQKTPWKANSNFFADWFCPSNVQAYY